MDVHHPYCIRKEYVKFYPQLKKVSQNYAFKIWRKVENIKKMKKEEIDILISLYKMNISYIDQAIGKLLKNFKNSLFIITADHGEEFGEHGNFHKPTFYNEMVRIPLIVYGLNNEKGKNESLISHVDLGPVLASLLSFDPDPYWSGTREIDKIKYQFAAYQDFDRSGICVMDKHYKYISEYIRDSEGKIYLVKRDSDGLEYNKEKEKELKLQLDNFLTKISKSKIRISETKISEEIKQQLQNLGYL